MTSNQFGRFFNQSRSGTRNAIAAERARLAEEARQAEVARLAEEARRAEEARQMEVARLAEEERLAAEAQLTLLLGPFTIIINRANRNWDDLTRDFDRYTNIIKNAKPSVIKSETEKFLTSAMPKYNKFAAGYIKEISAKEGSLNVSLIVLDEKKKGVIEENIRGKIEEYILELMQLANDTKTFIDYAKEQEANAAKAANTVAIKRRSSMNMNNNNGSRKRGNGPNNAKSPNSKKAKNKAPTNKAPTNKKN